MTQTIMTRNTQPKFRDFIQAPQVMKNVLATIGNETRGKRFMASLTSAVNNNLQLQKCDFGSIVNAGLLGEALNLSPSSQLGHFSLVPYWDSKNKRFVAQFQLGYKGYIQLAMRSGQYKDINVVAIKKGELVKCDVIKGKYEFQAIEDDEERENTETIGYYACIELLNGFTKEMYWSKKKMEAHARKYSKAYARDLEKGSSVALWSNPDMFDMMGCKTMLRQILSKYGVLSIEMEKAFKGDMGVINEVNDEEVNVDYIDNDYEKKQEEPKEEPQEPAYNEETGVVVEQNEIDFNSL